MVSRQDKIVRLTSKQISIIQAGLLGLTDQDSKTLNFVLDAVNTHNGNPNSLIHDVSEGRVVAGQTLYTATALPLLTRVRIVRDIQ